MPVHADHAEHTILVPDIEDVGPAVGQENTLFTVLLLLHKGEHLQQGGFSFLFASKCGDDLIVSQELPQSVTIECLFAGRAFDFAGVEEKPFGEIISKVTDLNLDFSIGVKNEVVFGNKPLVIS